MYTPSAFAVSDRDTLHDFIVTHSLRRWSPAMATSPTRAIFHCCSTATPANTATDWPLRESQSAIGTTRRSKRARGLHAPARLHLADWYVSRMSSPPGTTSRPCPRHAENRNKPGQLLDIVNRTVDVFEASQTTPWPLNAAELQFIDKLLDAIIVTIDIEQLEGKMEACQPEPLGRTSATSDRGTATRPDAGSQEVADLLECNV